MNQDTIQMILETPIRTGAVALGAALLLSGCGGDATSTPGLPEPTPLLSEEREYSSLEYSPDGTRITYVAMEGRVPLVWVADADGSEPMALTEGPGYAFSPEWSPDGSWITFQSDPLGSVDIFVVPAAGGEPRVLTPGPWYEGFPKPSPDGSRVLFESSRGGTLDLWTVAVDGGEPEAVNSAPGDDADPGWSPDGRWIAFTRFVDGGRTVWLHSVEDGTERAVTHEGFETFIPNGWSPDSRSLLYASNRTGLADVWAYSLETGESRQITDDIRWDGDAKYSPDGRWIAFRSWRGGQLDVWIVPSAGGDAVRITDDREREVNLRWRPDGRGLTYARNDRVRQIYALDVATGATRSVTPGDADRFVADISPDGTRALVMVDVGGSPDIHVVPLGGGESRPLVTSLLTDRRPRWSPDGSTVAFGSNRGEGQRIYLVPAEGGEETRLTDMPAGGWEWSPDGDRIAFLAPGPDGSSHLWVVAADGGDPVRISDLSGIQGGDGISWHPDGSSVLVVATVAGVPTVYRVFLEGGEPVRVVPDPFDAWAPAWSPDGRRFTYSAIHPDRPEAGADLYVADADGSNHVRLTNGPAWEFASFWSADGTTLYFHFQPTEGATQALAAIPAAGGEVRRLMDTSDRLSPLRRDPGTGELLFEILPAVNEYVTVEVGALLDAAEGARPPTTSRP